MGVVAGDAQRELDHVEPADIDRTGGVEPGEDGRGDAGRWPAHQRGPALGELAGAVEHVLVRQRHAVQRPERLAARRGPVGRVGRRQRALRIEPRHGVQRPGPGPSSAASTASRGLAAADLAGARSRRQLGQAPGEQLAVLIRRASVFVRRASSTTRKPPARSPNGRSRRRLANSCASSAAVSAAGAGTGTPEPVSTCSSDSPFPPPAADPAPLSFDRMLHSRHGAGGRGMATWRRRDGGEAR